MEMTTTFRYERTVPRAAALHRALARQNATIKDAEKLAADKAAINELVGTNQVFKIVLYMLFILKILMFNPIKLFWAESTGISCEITFGIQEI